MSNQTKMPTKRCAYLTVLFFLFMLASCSHQASTSQDGRKRCFNEANARFLSSEAKDRRDFFRDCLKSIDLKIAAEAEERKLKENAEVTQSRPIFEQSRAMQMSNSDRYAYCKMNQDRINELYKRLLNLKAKLINASKAGSPFAGQKYAFSQELNAIQNQLERVLPIQVRGEWRSIDIAITKFRSCSRSDFQLSP